MDDQKKIEEMAKIVDKVFSRDYKSDYESGIKDFATHLVESGAIVLPEDSVVLSKEEYNTLLLEQKRLKEIVDRIPCGYVLKEEVYKQAVEEVLDKALDWGKGFFIEYTFMEENEFEGILNEIRKIFYKDWNNMKEIAKDLLEKINKEEFCKDGCFGCCGDSKIDHTCEIIRENFEKELSEKLQVRRPNTISFPCRIGEQIFFVEQYDEGNPLIHKGVVKSMSIQEEGLWIYAVYDDGLTYWHKKQDIGLEIFFSDYDKNENNNEEEDSIKDIIKKFEMKKEDKRKMINFGATQTVYIGDDVYGE